MHSVVCMWKYIYIIYLTFSLQFVVTFLQEKSDDVLIKVHIVFNLKSDGCTYVGGYSV